MSQLSNLKKKPVIIAIVVALLLVVILFIINSSNDSATLVGTWIHTDGCDSILTLNKDGSYYDEYGDTFGGNQIGSWKVVSDGKLFVTGTSNSGLFDFELNGKTLILNPDSRWPITLKKT